MLTPGGKVGAAGRQSLDHKQDHQPGQTETIYALSLILLNVTLLIWCCVLILWQICLNLILETYFCHSFTAPGRRHIDNIRAHCTQAPRKGSQLSFEKEWDKIYHMIRREGVQARCEEAPATGASVIGSATSPNTTAAYSRTTSWSSNLENHIFNMTHCLWFCLP